MKLLYGNGRVFEVRDVGRVILRLRATDYPIKFNDYRIVEDAEARAITREIMDQGFVTRDKIEEPTNG